MKTSAHSQQGVFLIEALIGQLQSCDEVIASIVAQASQRLAALAPLGDLETSHG